MIKVAIIGTGAVSDIHIEAYLKFREQCQVSALIDLYPEKAAEKAARHGLKVPIFQTVKIKDVAAGLKRLDAGSLRGRIAVDVAGGWD